jgi:TRAP-type C4-dicarboxylate transport system permease small subunit
MAGRDRLHALIERLQMAQLWLAMCALMAMMLVTVADVALRYLFNRPIQSSYDIVESALVVFVFHGMASVFLRRKHIAIDLIDSLVGPRIAMLLIRFSDVLAVVILIGFAWAMITPALQAYEYGDYKIQLGIPLYTLWIVALIGMVGTIVCAIGALIGRVTMPRREEGVL